MQPQVAEREAIHVRSTELSFPKLPLEQTQPPEKFVINTLLTCEVSEALRILYQLKNCA